MNATEVMTIAPIMPTRPIPPTLLDLSLVLPTYNEAAHIDTVVDQLIAALDAIPALTLRNHHRRRRHPDRTWEIAQQLAQPIRKSAPSAAKANADCPPPFSAAGKSPAAKFSA